MRKAHLTFSSTSPKHQETGGPRAIQESKKDPGRIRLKGIFKKAIMAAMTTAAFTGATLENGHQCGGCAQCLPPPATRKIKEEEGSEDDENDDEENT